MAWARSATCTGGFLGQHLVGEASCDLRSTRYGFCDRECSPKFLCSFPHRGEADTSPISFIKAFAVVTYFNLKSILYKEAYMAGLRVGMTDDVGKGFLL